MVENLIWGPCYSSPINRGVLFIVKSFIKRNNKSYFLSNFFFFFYSFIKHLKLSIYYYEYESNFGSLINNFCLIINYAILKFIINVAGNECVLFRWRSLESGCIFVLYLLVYECFYWSTFKIPKEVKSFQQPNLILLGKNSGSGRTKIVDLIEHSWGKYPGLFVY